MKIYNEDKTKELNREDLDLNKGYLVKEKEIIHHHKEIKISGQGHYELLAEYPNGGKDVPEREEKPAYDEEVEYQRYIAYTNEQLLTNEYKEEIEDYKQKLNETDYLAIKYAEGWISEEDYASIKQQRQSYRDRINELEEEISKLDIGNLHY